MNVKNSAPVNATAERLTSVHRNYMQVAGTNIEDFDRAMRTSAAASPRPAIAGEPMEPEVTA